MCLNKLNLLAMTLSLCRDNLFQYMKHKFEIFTGDKHNFGIENWYFHNNFCFVMKIYCKHCRSLILHQIFKRIIFVIVHFNLHINLILYFVTTKLLSPTYIFNIFNNIFFTALLFILFICFVFIAIKYV